jgi:hypothetical protein
MSRRRIGASPEGAHAVESSAAWPHGTTVPPGRPAGTTVPPGIAPRGPGQATKHPARDPARLEQFQQSGPTTAPEPNRRRSSLLLRKRFPEDLYAGSAFYAAGAGWTICQARPEPVIRIVPCLG